MAFAVPGFATFHGRGFYAFSPLDLATGMQRVHDLAVTANSAVRADPGSMRSAA